MTPAEISDDAVAPYGVDEFGVPRVICLGSFHDAPVDGRPSPWVYADCPVCQVQIRVNAGKMVWHLRSGQQATTTA